MLESLGCQGSGNSLRILCGDPKQRPGRSLRPPPSLLPVPKCRHADTDHTGEFFLRLVQSRTDRPYVFRTKFSHPSGTQFPLTNSSRLFDTCDQAIEVFVFQSNPSLTNFRKVAVCRDVRSSWSFFRYIVSI